ncbi:MAG: tRNA dimethylallyltransferase [Proteobacteria bacterium]|nr:tRNA dimethylallyltransferase [Pseudomonadota bacterium]
MDGPAILLMGPTGAGKTDIAVELAASLPVEVVSVDSAMVYRGMDIGTAKPDAATLARAPHHLVDILDPAERYSAGRFLEDARAAVAGIVARGRVPLLVGGTMLYFRALQSGLAELPAADPAIRRQLDERAGREGWPALHAELSRLDPEAAARIQPADRQRIQRALEIVALTGRPASARLRQPLRTGTRGGDLRIVLAPADRVAMAQRIEKRFLRMMELGFLEEVRRLYGRGDLGPDLPSMRSVGYRQLWEHVAGREDLEGAVGRGIVATRQLAKRQLTWLRAEPGAEWVNALEKGASAQIRERAVRWLDAQG